MKSFVGTFIERTTNGTLDVPCGSVNPTIVFCWNLAVATANFGTRYPNVYFYFGASDGTTHRSIACYDGDALGTTVAKKWSRNAFCTAVDSVNVITEGVISALGTGKFTINFTTTDASAKEWGFLALQVPNAKVGQILSSTSVGTVTETVGFEAKCGLLFGNSAGNHPETSASSNAWTSLGVFDSALSQACMLFQSQDAQATSNTQRFHDTANILQSQLWGGPAFIVAAVDLLSSTAFRLNFATTTGVARYFFYAVWDPPNVKVEPAQTYPTSTGSVTYDPGFTPKAILQLGAGCTVAQQDARQNDAMLDFGAADDSANQGVVWIGSEDNLGTSNTNRYQDASNVSVQYDKTGTTLQQKGAVTGLHLVGAKVDWTTVPGTALSGAWLQMGDANGNTWTDTADNVWKDLSDTAWYPQNITGGLIKHPGMAAGMQLMAGGVRG